MTTKAFRRTRRLRTLGFAGACAAGLTAGAGQAGIISSGIVDQDVPLGGDWLLDMNGDSTDEFRFNSVTGMAFATTMTSLNGLFLQDGAGIALRLADGTTIDASGTYSSTNDYSVLTTLSGGGDWDAPYPVTGYLGLSFAIGGGTHYGWVRITGTGHSAITVNEWAYEDLADTAIRAGDTGASVPVPGTALLIGAGLGIGAWRRRSR